MTFHIRPKNRYNPNQILGLQRVVGPFPDREAASYYLHCHPHFQNNPDDYEIRLTFDGHVELIHGELFELNSFDRELKMEREVTRNSEKRKLHLSLLLAFLSTLTLLLTI